MLCLTQRENHPNDIVDIYLPDGRMITVCLLETRKGQAKIGYEAPKDIKIVRRKIQPTPEV